MAGILQRRRHTAHHTSLPHRNQQVSLNVFLAGVGSLTDHPPPHPPTMNVTNRHYKGAEWKYSRQTDTTVKEEA